MSEILARQQTSIAQLQRQFCDSALVGAGADHFIVLLSSGAVDTVFAFTPEHAKAFSQHLAYQVEQFEKNVRKLDVTWSPNIPSPINSSDLKKGN